MEAYESGGDVSKYGIRPKQVPQVEPEPLPVPEAKVDAELEKKLRQLPPDWARAIRIEMAKSSLSFEEAKEKVAAAIEGTLGEKSKLAAITPDQSDTEFLAEAKKAVLEACKDAPDIMVWESQPPTLTPEEWDALSDHDKAQMRGFSRGPLPAQVRLKLGDVPIEIGDLRASLKARNKELAEKCPRPPTYSVMQKATAEQVMAHCMAERQRDGHLLPPKIVVNQEHVREWNRLATIGELWPFDDNFGIYFDPKTKEIESVHNNIDL